MTSGKQDNPGSRFIRERAMKVLRETRAKIDPALLAVMKERLSPISGQASAPPPTAPPLPATNARADHETVKSFSPQQFSPSSQETAEPVDRQKIAQIVLQYMKNREDGSRH